MLQHKVTGIFKYYNNGRAIASDRVAVKVRQTRSQARPNMHEPGDAKTIRLAWEITCTCILIEWSASIVGRGTRAVDSPKQPGGVKPSAGGAEAHIAPTTEAIHRRVMTIVERPTPTASVRRSPRLTLKSRWSTPSVIRSAAEDDPLTSRNVRWSSNLRQLKTTTD